MARGRPSYHGSSWGATQRWSAGALAARGAAPHPERTPGWSFGEACQCGAEPPGRVSR